MIEAKRAARDERRLQKLRETEARKAEEDRELAQFLLRRDDAIKAEQEKLERLVQEWQQRNEAKQKTI